MNRSLWTDIPNLFLGKIKDKQETRLQAITTQFGRPTRLKFLCGGLFPQLDSTMICKWIACRGLVCEQLPHRRAKRNFFMLVFSLNSTMICKWSISESKEYNPLFFSGLQQQISFKLSRMRTLIFWCGLPLNLVAILHFTLIKKDQIHSSNFQVSCKMIFNVYLNQWNLFGILSYAFISHTMILSFSTLQVGY